MSGSLWEQPNNRKREDVQWFNRPDKSPSQALFHLNTNIVFVFDRLASFFKEDIIQNILPIHCLNAPVGPHLLSFYPFIGLVV